MRLGWVTASLLGSAAGRLSASQAQPSRVPGQRVGQPLGGLSGGISAWAGGWRLSCQEDLTHPF